MKKLLFVLLMCFSTMAAAFGGNIEKVVFFGDSLTDNGNLYWVSMKIIPKSPPYYNGQFSNGPSWADTVAKELTSKYGLKTENFAVGGANVLFHNPIDGFLPYVFAQEVNHYLLESPFIDRSKILYVIWIGANEYTNIDKPTSPTAVTDKIMSSINKLISHGAKNFMILSLPDLGKTPFGQQDFTVFHDRTLAHNEALFERVNALQESNKDLKIVYFDIYTTFNDILNNIDVYNEKYNTHITDVTNSCWTGGYTLQKNQKNAMKEALKAQLDQAGVKQQLASGAVDSEKLADDILQNPSLNEAYTAGYLYSRGLATPCESPDEHLFWDHIHPSAATHSILAQAFMAKLLEDKFIQ